MNFEYDVVVIGSGPGGYVAAIRAAQLGHKTAIIEKDNLGGVCLNWGCIPTKALLKSSEVYSILKKSDYYGISAKEITFDFDKVINRSRDVAKSLSDGIGFLLKKNNIDHISGNAEILDENLLKLTNKSKDRDISFKNLIIATGASAKELPNISFTSNIWSYREAMTPKELPKSLAVIGSGAIGVEFANFYNSLGVDVTVIELADKILPVEDNEISDYAKNEFEKQGIKFQIGSYVESVEEKKDGCHLKVVSNSDKSVSNLKSDKVIMAVGITGNINNIGLENVNIKTENGHILTNENMQTNVSNIYAIGDVAGAPWLAHKASHEGIIAVDFLSGLSVHPINNNNIPGCVYSSPQVASVGLTEEKAKEQFQSIRVGKFPLVANGKAKAISNDTGFVKVIYDKETGELLGAHMIGEGVTELIHGYTIAKNMEGTEEDIINTIFPHPTISESLHEAVLSAYDRPIHFK
ncbi:MAG: dihydrolipoyl dehydrogenase [Rhizobiales bacterium]|jgi:dihydrolipoamide dehydrogenase|nr:dihydrolipoyl dehydrogenase [Hyphomicrobiales bacterium]